MKKRLKIKADLYGTIGVRVPIAKNVSKVYTYKVRTPSMRKLHLGMEVVVPFGEHINTIGYVVAIHSKPQDTELMVTYKFIVGKVLPL